MKVFIYNRMSVNEGHYDELKGLQNCIDQRHIEKKSI